MTALLLRLPTGAAKFLRCSLVAMIFVPAGQLLLNVCIHLLGSNAVPSNLAVAPVLTPANYLADKRWSGGIPRAIG